MFPRGMCVSTLPNINLTASPVPLVYSSVTLFCFQNARGCERHSEPSHQLWSVAPAIELSVNVLLTLAAGYTKRRNSFHESLTYSLHFPPSLHSESKVSTENLSPHLAEIFLQSSGTGKEHFLQTQTKCRVMQRKKEGESCVCICAWACETLQVAGVNVHSSQSQF